MSPGKATFLPCSGESEFNREGCTLSARVTESPRAHFELAEAYIQMDQDQRAATALRYDSGYPRAQRRLREVERRLSPGENQK